MRMKDPWALKGKHFHVPRVTCPLPDATIRLSPLPKISKPALPGLEQLPLLLHIPVTTAAQLLQLTVTWPSGLLLVWPKKDVDLPRFIPEPDHCTHGHLQAQGRWKGAVNNPGGLAGDTAKLRVSAIGSAAVQLCRKAPICLGHPWVSGIPPIHDANRVTLGSYFQQYTLALTMWIHLGSLTTTPELMKTNVAADFLTKLPPKDPEAQTVEEHNLRSLQEMSIFACPSIIALPYWPLWQMGSCWENSLERVALLFCLFNTVRSQKRDSDKVLLS